MSMWNPQPMAGRSQPLDYEANYTGQGVMVQFFNAVYAWMAAGLALTAVVGWLVYTHRAAMESVMSRGAAIGIFIAELVLVVVISSAIRAINATMATLLFLVFAALNGLMLSVIFLVYTLPSIGATFAACASMFAVMSIYGMVTKTDLTRLGKIMFMALIGLIVATIINIFVASSALYWLVSYAGVINLRGADGLRHAAASPDGPEHRGQLGAGGANVDRWGAGPLPRFHQYVPVPAADPGK
jgi:uncharacterized protein